jgi:hypothetical protein
LRPYTLRNDNDRRLGISGSVLYNVLADLIFDPERNFFQPEANLIKLFFSFVVNDYSNCSMCIESLAEIKDFASCFSMKVQPSV